MRNPLNVGRTSKIKEIRNPYYDEAVLAMSSVSSSGFAASVPKSVSCWIRRSTLSFSCAGIRADRTQRLARLPLLELNFVLATWGLGKVTAVGPGSQRVSTSHKSEDRLSQSPPLERGLQRHAAPTIMMTVNPFPLILNPPNPPILNPPNIAPICNKGEVLLLGGGGV